VQRNKFLGVALAAGLAVTAVSACGGGGGGSLSLGGTKTSTPSGSSGATGKVTSAITGVGQDAGVQLVLSLEGSPSSFPASAKLTQQQLQAILNSQLIIATHSANGKSLTQSAGSGSTGDFQIALVNSGANLGTIEIIGKTLYLRIDINKTASAYGLTTGKAAEVQQALQAEGSAIPGLSALSAGQWVSADLTPLLQLEQQSASTSTTTAGSGLSAASEKQLIEAAVQAFKQNSTITEVGPANGGTKYQAVVREKALVTALGQAAQGIPGLGSKASSLNGSNISATQTVTVDVILKGDTLSELQVPLNQFDTKNTFRGPVTLDIGIAGSPAITAPSGATSINVSNILSELGAASGKGSTPTS
jgi:hypothetical protein